MFQSKVPAFLRSVISRVQHDNVYSRISSFRFLSDASPGTDTTTAKGADISPKQMTVKQEATPDKLYSKVEVEVRGNDPAVLKSYGEFVVMAAGHLGITVGRNMAPRKAIHERYTVLKSVHIYKKHRVQYEMRTYYRFLDFLKLTGSTADTLLEYIQRNLPEGVAMKVTKVELQKLPESFPS